MRSRNAITAYWRYAAYRTFSSLWMSGLTSFTRGGVRFLLKWQRFIYLRKFDCNIFSSLFTGADGLWGWSKVFITARDRHWYQRGLVMPRKGAIDFGFHIQQSILMKVVQASSWNGKECAAQFISWHKVNNGMGDIMIKVLKTPRFALADCPFLKYKRIVMVYTTLKRTIFIR